MGKQTNQTIEDAYDSLTRLVTEEVASSHEFADGVLGAKRAQFYHHHNAHVKGNGWTFYYGQDETEYECYIEANDLPQSWDAFGCSEEDCGKIIESFENNPFMIQWDGTYL